MTRLLHALARPVSAFVFESHPHDVD
jgi:hypothetical protein